MYNINVPTNKTSRSGIFCHLTLSKNTKNYLVTILLRKVLEIRSNLKIIKVSFKKIYYSSGVRGASKSGKRDHRGKAPSPKHFVIQYKSATKLINFKKIGYIKNSRLKCPFKKSTPLRGIDQWFFNFLELLPSLKLKTFLHCHCGKIYNIILKIK